MIILMVDGKSERIPRRFCLTPVVLPVGSASAARAAGSFNLLEIPTFREVTETTCKNIGGYKKKTVESIIRFSVRG